MRHIFTTFLILLAVTSFVWAQGPLQGTWLGHLRQDRRPEAEDFTVRLELEQNGTRVSGITYIHVTDQSQYYARMRLEGNLFGAVFVFEESAILAERHPSDWDWCLKNGRLTLRTDGGFWRLEGSIGGKLGSLECAPGQARLERLKEPDPIEPQVQKPPVQTTPTEEPAGPQVKNPPSTPDKSAVLVDNTLMGRKITRQREVEVYQEDLVISVYDADKEDGDVVSMSFNGQWMLRNYAINKEMKEIRVKVTPGADNRLILFAENEGTLPPNTAALSFYDGRTVRKLNLTSDKSTCGALYFKVLR